MKLGLLQKLLALLLMAGVAPLVVVSVLLISIGRDHVESSVREVHQLEANAAAASVTAALNDVRERLSADLEGSIESMSDEEIQRALVWMLGKQDNMLLIRVLRVHDNLGVPLGEAVRLPAESIPAEHRESFLVEDRDLDDFQRAVPLKAALGSGDAEISGVYVNERRREALVAFAVPLKDRLKQVTAVVTAEVSLRPVQRTIADVTIGQVGHAYLVDARGIAVAHPQFDRVRERESLAAVPIVSEALAHPQPDALAYQGPDGVALLGAHAPVFWGGWQLVVEQPQSDAYRAVDDMKKRAGFILLVALAASLGAGVLYVRSLMGPLREVMAGMQRIVDGQFEQRLEVRGGDEVGQLAAAFNTMGRMLGKYKAEVEGWNRELQSRVDAKTRALESAQAQLVQSAKLSAVGQLGAGVAHELNNPLAGVVGQAALLKRRLKKCEGLSGEDRERLEGYVSLIEAQSSRCREIVHGLLSFSQASSVGADSLDLNASVEKLLVLVGPNLRASGISIVPELGAGLPAIRANEQQLQQVVMHLLTNAQQAMPQGGQVTLATRRSADGVAIVVRDTGRGIAPEHLQRIFEPFFTTKDVWQSTGLGLSVCYSIVEGHGGRIEVESEPGRGSTFTVHLPRVAPFAAQAPPAERVQEPGGLRRGRPVAAGS